MKILVIEDNQVHQAAAKRQLESVGHDVLILESFTDFSRKVLGLVRASDHYRKPEIELGSFDAVLTDVHLPSFNDMTREETSSPTGFLVAMAALSAGVKMIGVVTDANHHEDYVSKGLDAGCFFQPFLFGENRIYLTNSCMHSIEFDGQIVYEKDWIHVLNILIKGEKESWF